jgi:predicted site-specific integrase-resolvase
MSLLPEGYVSAKEARKYLNVTSNTLRVWADKGKIECIRSGKEGTHRFYKIKNFLEDCSNKPKHPSQEEKKPERRKICYCRVSTRNQRDDLGRQEEYLRSRYPNHEYIKDIGSGINFKRKGLKAILEQAFKGNIEELVVAHKDRLCRFGFDIFKYIIEELSGGKVVVLDDSKSSPEQELVSDVLSIINVFSARINGLRKYKTRIKNDLEANKNSKGGVDDGGRSGGDEQVQEGVVGKSVTVEEVSK